MIIAIIVSVSFISCSKPEPSKEPIKEVVDPDDNGGDNGSNEGNGSKDDNGSEGDNGAGEDNGSGEGNGSSEGDKGNEGDNGSGEGDGSSEGDNGNEGNNGSGEGDGSSEGDNGNEGNNGSGEGNGSSEGDNGNEGDQGDSGGGSEREQDDLECPAPPKEGTVEMDCLTGYGEKTTGGKGASAANVLHFDNGKALQTWLLARTKAEKGGDHSPVEIWLSGTFGPGDGRDFSEAHPWFDIKDVSNISFFGVDGFTMDRIGFFAVRSNNIIIRNIYFRQPKADNGADACSIQECSNMWIDHCTFESLNQTHDYEDGSCDITHGSKAVTVSWCHFIKTQKTCLVGHSNSATGDVEITVTFHHNWFDASSSRHPRVRYGRAHVYNNYYDGCTTYGAGAAYGAKVLVEYNSFNGVQLPTDICTYPAKEGDVSNLEGSVAGYLYACGNHYSSKPEKARSPYPLTNTSYSKYGAEAGTPLEYSDFKPEYSYTVTPSLQVSDIVMAGAGAHILKGFEKAPVDVNNGGVNVGDNGGSGDDSGNGDDSGSSPVEGSVTWSSDWFKAAGSISAAYSSEGLTFTPVGSYSQKNYSQDGTKYYYCQTDGKFSFSVNTGGQIKVEASSSGSSKRTLVLTIGGKEQTTTATVPDGNKTTVTIPVEPDSISQDGTVIGFNLSGGKVNVYSISWVPTK